MPNVAENDPKNIHNNGARAHILLVIMHARASRQSITQSRSPRGPLSAHSIFEAISRKNRGGGKEAKYMSSSVNCF